jgi:hypothetical protein
VDTPSTTRRDAVEPARYKLRQAELALGYLRQVPAQIALDQRRVRPLRIPDIRLDTFFFACLGLSKSAFNIIRNGQGGRYKGAISSWREHVLVGVDTNSASGCGTRLLDDFFLAVFLLSIGNCTIAKSISTRQ